MISTSFDFCWKFLGASVIAVTVVYGAFLVLSPFVRFSSGIFVSKLAKGSVLVLACVMVSCFGLLVFADTELQSRCLGALHESSVKLGWMKYPFVIVWLLVSAALLARDVIRYHRFNVYLRSHTMGSGSGYVMTQGPLSSLTWGLKNPQVYLPELLAQNSDRLQHVLAHEKAHISHQDTRWSFLALVVSRLLWFHPLIYLFEKSRIVALEMAADERAIEVGQFSVKAYCQSLLTCLQEQRYLETAQALHATTDFRQLQIRIRNLDPSREKSRFKCVVALGLTFIAWGWGSNESVAALGVVGSVERGVMCCQSGDQGVIKLWIQAPTEPNKCE